LPHQRAGQPLVEPSSFTEIERDTPRSAANAAGIFAEGSRFGAYVIGPCIGHGETGRIYRAEHEAIRTPLALKVFANDFSRTAVGRNRFLREARFAATVRHPSLVDIFDVGVQDGIPYLVMELLEGEDLGVLLHSRGALDEGAIVDLIVPVVAGLASLHDVGIVHGDLKTANIFLVHRGNRGREPKLLDFGISRATLGERFGGLSGTRGLFRGSPLYLAPEAARGGPVSPLSDQYSLGVVMYECAVGLNPFVADTVTEGMRRIINGEYPPLSRHEARPSESLVRIVERAMSLDPASRVSDLKALGRELLMLSGERTRMNWSLSFGEGRAGAALRHRKPSARAWLGQRFSRDRLVAPEGLNYSSLVFVLLGVVSFGWAIALLIAR
jgi:serine/threonine protein kinase